MIKGVLFDFDGVLIDSKQSTIAYFQETFRHFKIPVPREEDFENILGLKTIDMLKKLLPHLSDGELAPIFDYNRKMSIKYVSKITLTPNAIEALTLLKGKYALGLITSRSKQGVKMLFDMYKLDRFFPVVLDREDVSHHKPHPEGIETAMRILHLKSNEVVYIGDTKEDIEAAHNANIICVYISNHSNDFNADYKISKIEELPGLLKKIEG